MSQLFQTEDHYILHEGQHSLWCSRHNGTIEAKKGIVLHVFFFFRSGDDICSAWNPVCIGLVYGLIGKIKIHPDEEWRLLLIKERSLVGRIAEKHEVYRINKIVIIPLSSAEPQELDLDRCQVHHFGIRKNQTISQTGGSQRQLQNAWKTIKTGVDIVKTRKKEIKEREKFAKRICEEIFKLYNDTDSFFVCETFDLTKSIQRQSLSDTTKDGQLDWNNADPRFFWNRYMVSELLDMDVNEETRSLNSHWVVPIIQGYIQIENCLLDFDKSSPELSPEFSGSKHIEPMEYTIILISRRSIHRADHTIPSTYDVIRTGARIGAGLLESVRPEVQTSAQIR
ncbi:hypothetical protein FSP39_019195 [Pinctada imbricata]|uniref:SAC domain-containing protein n=1 Tax=Pinctada imbricata TaxID=66713 RepID=A0AA89BTY7_PINIB|nr:hypothetical protein FSP39_019195 [Pinctada imbricata]